MAAELAYKNDRVDVDDVMRVGRGSRVIGVTFAEDKRSVLYFDNLVNTSNALNAPVPTGGFGALRDLCSDPNRLIDAYQFRTGTTNVIAVPTLSPANEFGRTVYVDLQASYMAPWSGRITLGVRNLFDRDPPFSSDAFANSFDAQYRTPGRFLYMSYQQQF